MRTGCGVSCAACRTARGVTFLELLAAVLILSIVAAGAVKTWSLSSRVPATLRRTEMSSKIAVREIETVKAKKYANVATGTVTYPSSGYNWYDTSGTFVGSPDTGVNTAPSTAVYRAITTVQAAPGTTSTNTTKDLLEVKTVVSTTTGTTLETQRTLMTFGGF